MKKHDAIVGLVAGAGLTAGSAAAADVAIGGGRLVAFGLPALAGLVALAAKKGKTQDTATGAAVGALLVAIVWNLRGQA